MLDKQLRRRDQHAHLVGHQEECVDEAVNRLEQTQDELARARFSLNRAQAAHLELAQEIAGIDSPPAIMYEELRKRAEKRDEYLRIATDCEQRVAERDRAVDQAQEHLAFDRDQQAKILIELKTITDKIEQLSANVLKS